MKIVGMRIYNRENQYRVFGLIGFEVAVENVAGSNSLQLRVGEFKQDFAVADLRDSRPGANRPETVLVFHLNTFLLENGQQTVEVFDSDGAGNTLGSRLAAYEIEVENASELARSTAGALKRARMPSLLPAMVDSSHFGDHAAAQIRPWYDRETHVSRPASILRRNAPAQSANTRQAQSKTQALSDLQTNGYCVLPDRIPESLCDELVAQAKAFVDGQGRQQGYQWGSSQRVMDTHKLAAGKQVWLFPPVLDFLREWFRDEPVACQTLFYFFGSQQRAHQDTIHLTSFPAGYMCGVWVALEDVVPGAGELFVYPKSHKLKRLRSRELGLDKVAADYSSYVKFDDAVGELLESSGIEKVPYLAKKGSVLIWHENLIHGGEQRINLESSRLSIVSHYFAKGAVAYYDARGEAANLSPAR